MSDLPTAKEVTDLAMLLVPGLLILGIRARFREGAVPDLKDKLVSYAVASTVYYAVVAPAFYVPHGVRLPAWLWDALHYFVVPSAAAMLIVFLDQTEYLYRLADRLKLRLAHHIPAAWDYAFSRMDRGTFVWIKLNSGTEYAGKMGRASFASSSTAERDLYIEEVWEMHGPGEPWTLLEPVRGVLLCGKDIQRVEIFRG
jgi:hypothetical protein